jgi:hypothetical protein
MQPDHFDVERILGAALGDGLSEIALDDRRRAVTR